MFGFGPVSTSAQPNTSSEWIATDAPTPLSSNASDHGFTCPLQRSLASALVDALNPRFCRGQSFSSFSTRMHGL